MIKSPAAILFDINGITTAVSASDQPTSGALGHVMAGFDETSSIRYASFVGDALSIGGSVTALGDNAVALQQDASNRLVVIDDAVSGSINDTKLTLSSSITAFSDRNHTDLLAISGAIVSSEITLSGALAQIYAELDSGSVDIRNLEFTLDSITAWQGGVWSVTGSGDVGTLKQDPTSRELIVSGSTFLARGNDGTADQNLRTDNFGKLQVSISSGSVGAVSVLTGSQFASFEDRAFVVHISPNQQPVPVQLTPESAAPGISAGRVAGAGAGVFSPVRQTVYVEQTTNAQRSIVSTSANDSAAGTGARTVVITYLDDTGAGPFAETVTLNGTTAVNTVNNNICFIESIAVATVGSNGSNVGTLNLYTGTGATGIIFAAVGTGAVAAGVGDNRTFYAQHYVPSGKSVRIYALLAGIVAAAGGGSSVTVLRSRNPTSIIDPWHVVSDFINASQGNSLNRPYPTSIRLAGPAVVLAYATPTNNNSTATCSFDWSEQ